jgi:NAD-dependent histone deacetylase SIR2
MNPKKNSGRSVAISKRKAQPNALDTLGDNPTEDEIKTAAANVALADLEERVADVRESWETDSLFEDAFEELSSDNTVALDGELVVCLLLSYLSLFHFSLIFC